VVALASGAAPERWQGLQDAQVNVVRQNPRGFLLLAEDTLSRDPDLRPINVRRLLILLRRLALRRGATYVFEPLSDGFRRMIERGFEEALSDLFQRGAFAGKTAATSYQVVVGPDVNTPQALDQGRFVVELKVAPSIPMRFLSVRLVQAGERLAATEGR
jgi:phage tail sheath protein FI